MPDELELRRGLFHLVCGITAILLIKFEFLTKWLLLILIAASLLMSLISKKYRIPIIYWFLEKFERKENIKKFPGKGAIFYLIGIAIVLFFFPNDIALASIAILAIADPVSRFIGIHFGKIRNPINNAKFIEGAVGGVISGFLAAMIFVTPAEAFFAAFFAMVAEGIEVRLGVQRVDDNIVIPVIAAVVIKLMRVLSGLL